MKVALKNLVEIKSGYSPSTFELMENGSIPYVKVEDMNNCTKYQSESREYCEDVDRSVPAGAIIFPKRGAAIMNNKVRITVTDICMDTNMMAIIPNGKIQSEFLYYTITHEKLSRIADTSTIPQINNKHINPYKVALPPLPEQKAIADLLSTWDEAIEKTERLIQAKEKRLNGLFQHYFVPGRSNNIHWKKVKIGKVLKQRNKKAIPSENRPLFSLTIEDGVTPKTDRYNREALVKDNGSKKYKIVCPDDIVFNPANLRWGAIARSKVPHEVVISPIYEVLSVKNDSVDIDFISHLLTCPRQIGIYATKTEGTLIERMAVKLDAFLLLDIHLPSERGEQQKISNILNTAQQEIDLLKQLAEKYKTQKRGLMQKMLTGEWRVKPEVVKRYEL